MLGALYASGMTEADVYKFNMEGTLHYSRLMNNPGMFFTDIKEYYNIYGPGNFFGTSNSFWGYVRFIFLFKLIAVMDLITGTSLYLNCLVFSTLIFPAHIAFYRVAHYLHSGSHTGLKLAACFFIPSLLLYTSCPHKDGLVFLALGIASFVYYRWLHEHRLHMWVHAGGFLLAVLILLFLRNFVLVAMVPAMLAGALARSLPGKQWVAVTLFYACCAGLFFASGFLKGSANLPQAVVSRRVAFDEIPVGNTQLHMDTLLPTTAGFARNLPDALNHALLRPYPSVAAGTALLLASLEPYFYFVLLLLMLFTYKRPARADAYTIYAIAFFISMMLIIGYTIPNAGAIVRYRSIFWIFLLTPVIGNIGWLKKEAVST